jgi:hypothetical protein
MFDDSVREKRARIIVLRGILAGKCPACAKIFGADNHRKPKQGNEKKKTVYIF